MPDSRYSTPQPSHRWIETIAFVLSCLSCVMLQAQAPQPGPAPASRPMRIAMSSAFVSEAGVALYEKINDYVAAKSGIPCEFVTGLSYGTINRMLADGAVDIAFVCGLPYVIDRDQAQPHVALLVAPVMKAKRYQDRPKYFSDLIVAKDSGFRSLADLRGKTYVYNDEMSNSGYNMPRFKLIQMGETRGYFGNVLRSGSHEESIRMVAEGKADASFVDSLVLDYDRTKGLGHAAKVRVIESLGPAGICPVVVSLKTPEGRRLKLQEVFLSMHQDTAGRKLLDDALVARFERVEDSNYDDIRAMRKAAEEAGFATIK